jgi:O-antigen/teichoic acid export membrane protein
LKLTDLISKIAGFVGARLLGAAIGFTTQLVLARVLPIEQVGIVFLGMSAAALVALAANGGYSLLASTEMPKLEARRQHAAIQAFYRIATMDGIFTYIFLCLAALALWQFIDLNEGQKIAIILGFICAPASFAIRFNSSVAVAVRYYRTSYIPDFILRPGAFLIGIFVLSLLDVLHTALVTLIVFVTVTYMAMVGQAWALHEHRVSFKHLGWPRKFFAKPLRSRALALTLVSATMLAFADVVILVASFVLPEREVAIAGVAMRLAAIAGFVLQAGQSLVMTDFTQALVRRDEAAVHGLLKRVNGITFIIVAGGLLGAIVLGKFVLGLFGAEYQTGATLLVMFMVGQSLRALGGMNQQILSINGFQMRTAGSCVIALVVFVSLAILLCRNFGSIGLGYAVIISEITWLLALASQASSLCGRRGDVLWLLQKR